MKNISEYENLLKEIYNDFLKKRNRYKIEKDNYETEIEIIRRKIEYSENAEDESKLFSPREVDRRRTDSMEDLLIKKEELELVLDEVKEKYNYYNDYCIKLSPFVNKEDDDSAASAVEETERFVNEHMNEDIVYNLSLNYDLDDVRNKLSGTIHKLDVCLKIFDNDNERAKNEIKSAGKSLKEVLETLK